MKSKIPKDYFIVTGSGESNVDVHTGSYHLALANAGVGEYNIVEYSSMMSAESNRVEQPEIPWGAVLEVISSHLVIRKGESGTSGIGFRDVFLNEKKVGSIVAERKYKHQANADSRISRMLDESLDEIETGFKDRGYIYGKTSYITNEFSCNKEYGSVLVMICFVNYSSYDI